MGPQRDRTERPGVVLDAMEIGHERHAGHKVRAEHVLPRQHVEQPGAGQEQRAVEDDVEHEEPEHHPEERAGGSLERRDRPGHGHAEQREHPEMEDRVGSDEAQRRLRSLLVEQRRGEGGGRVERLARNEVHHEKPECHDQPRQTPTHRALDDDTLQRSLHDRTLHSYSEHVSPQYRVRRPQRNRPPAPARARPCPPAPARYGIFAAPLPILVSMTGHATPPELPPGLLEEYLAGMRPVLVALVGLAERLAAARNDLAALEALRRETHKIHGSAGSFGFMEVSRLAAGMEATVKDWISWPGDPEVDRGSLTRWFVARLAEMLGLEVPPPAPPAPAGEVPEIVFVEDDAALAELLAYGLSTRGYRFVAYRNGREALKELLALDVRGTHPLLLLDVDLPALDGYSILDALERARPGTYRVVFTTVHGTEEEQLRGLEAGAPDYPGKTGSPRVGLAKSTAR